jgi:hypothetical protein
LSWCTSSVPGCLHYARADSTDVSPLLSSFSVASPVVCFTRRLPVFAEQKFLNSATDLRRRRTAPRWALSNAGRVGLFRTAVTRGILVAGASPLFRATPSEKSASGIAGYPTNPRVTPARAKPGGFSITHELRSPFLAGVPASTHNLLRADTMLDTAPDHLNT